MRYSARPACLLLVCFVFLPKNVPPTQPNAKAFCPLKPKSKGKRASFHYIVVQYQGEIAMKKRLLKDIWAEMYDFHLVESTGAITTRRPRSTRCLATKNLARSIYRRGIRRIYAYSYASENSNDFLAYQAPQHTFERLARTPTFLYARSNG